MIATNKYRYSIDIQSVANSINIETSNKAKASGKYIGFESGAIVENSVVPTAT